MYDEVEDMGGVLQFLLFNSSVQVELVIEVGKCVIVSFCFKGDVKVIVVEGVGFE